MTEPIEYTYSEPERTGAIVNGVYGVSIPHPGWVTPPKSNIEGIWVPKICEAMMTLAGHEWPPKGRCSICLEEDKAVAERIIARLKKLDAINYNGPQMAKDAIRIVREECGVES